MVLSGRYQAVTSVPQWQWYSKIDGYGHNAMFHCGEYKKAFFLRMQDSIEYTEKIKIGL